MLIYFAYEAAGAAGTRHSLRPLFSWRETAANLGRDARRECEVCPVRFEDRIGEARVMRWPSTFSSCPALCRASTSYFLRRCKDVDGRDKPGHDGGESGCFEIRINLRRPRASQRV